MNRKPFYMFLVVAFLFLGAGVVYHSKQEGNKSSTSTPIPAQTAAKKATYCDTMLNKSPDVDYDGDEKGCGAIVRSVSVRADFKLESKQVIFVRFEYSTFRTNQDDLGSSIAGERAISHVREQLSFKAAPDFETLSTLLEEAKGHLKEDDALIFGEPQLITVLAN